MPDGGSADRPRPTPDIVEGKFRPLDQAALPPTEGRGRRLLGRILGRRPSENRTPSPLPEVEADLPLYQVSDEVKAVLGRAKKTVERGEKTGENLGRRSAGFDQHLNRIEDNIGRREEQAKRRLGETGVEPHDPMIEAELERLKRSQGK